MARGITQEIHCLKPAVVLMPEPNAPSVRTRDSEALILEPSLHRHPVSQVHSAEGHGELAVALSGITADMATSGGDAPHIDGDDRRMWGDAPRTRNSEWGEGM